MNNQKSMPPNVRKKMRSIPRSDLSKHQVRLLKSIVRHGKSACPDSAADEVATLLQRGCLLVVDDYYVLTPEGKQALRRARIAEEEGRSFEAQHQDRQIVRSHGDKKTSLVNRNESPLAALAARKRSDGRPLISSTQLEAGERFRQDFERGQLGPMMGINWDKLGNAGGAAKGRGGLDRIDIADSALMARKRFSQAAGHVGEELSGILIDVCCFLKGLELIEKERQWPARSAKQILSLALDRLARHYGLAECAEGPLHNLMRHWGTDDYRPQM